MSDETKIEVGAIVRRRIQRGPNDVPGEVIAVYGGPDNWSKAPAVAVVKWLYGPRRLRGQPTESHVRVKNLVRQA